MGFEVGIMSADNRYEIQCSKISLCRLNTHYETCVWVNETH